MINEKDVVKNVNAATVNGTRAEATASRSSGRMIRGPMGALVLSVVAVFGSMSAAPAQARSHASTVTDASDGSPVALASLPPEAQQTMRRIRSGGPFPFPKDGVVFGNYEKRLERHPRGYYHEYTVPTPGSRHRGAHRVVCGGDQPTEPDACFYTEDHYNSFHRIVK